MSRPRAVIVGASTRREKFGNKSLRAHRNAGYEVVAVTPAAREVEGEPAYPNLESLPPGPYDRVSFYVTPAQLLPMLEALVRLDVKEVWFNPGTDSPEVLERARELGLPVRQGCSILDVGQDPAEL